MEASLAAVQAQPQARRTDAFLSLLSTTLSSETSPNVTQELYLFVQAVISEASGLVVSRQVLADFVKALSTFAAPALKEPEVKRNVIEQSIELLTPRVVTYEEQVSPRVLIQMPS